MPDSSETSIDEYHDFRMAAGPIERIADHSQRIANVASKIQEPVRKDVMEVIENLSSTYMGLVEQAVDALYNSDTSLANQVIDSIDGMRLRVTELHASILKLESHKTMISLGTIVDSLSRIGDLGSNIAEIAINSAIKDK